MNTRDDMSSRLAYIQGEDRYSFSLDTLQAEMPMLTRVKSKMRLCAGYLLSKVFNPNRVDCILYGKSNTAKLLDDQTLKLK